MKNFVKRYPIKKFAKGEVILQQGDVPTQAYVVKSGFVKVYNINSQGDERPVLFHIAQEIFPIGWVFRVIKSTHFYYEAFTDCEVYLVPRADYIAFLKQRPDEMFKALDYCVERQVGQQLRVHALEQSKARDKLLYNLEFLARRFGRAKVRGQVKLALPLTQQDIANFVGITRETAAIELKRLQREGVISYRRQIYIVNLSKLQDMLESR